MLVCNCHTQQKFAHGLQHNNSMHNKAATLCHSLVPVTCNSMARYITGSMLLQLQGVNKGPQTTCTCLHSPHGTCRINDKVGGHAAKLSSHRQRHACHKNLFSSRQHVRASSKRCALPAYILAKPVSKMSTWLTCDGW